ncbi:hypothetical protein DFH09DRAFT_1098218 [Mycena vulgaris]|nr:hypothetical protein DFH09DRAFT_1098218 [Mycena vulgaris]
MAEIFESTVIRMTRKAENAETLEIPPVTNKPQCQPLTAPLRLLLLTRIIPQFFVFPHPVKLLIRTGDDWMPPLRIPPASTRPAVPERESPGARCTRQLLSWAVYLDRRET